MRSEELLVGIARIGRARGLPVPNLLQLLDARTRLRGIGAIGMLLQKLLVGLAAISFAGRLPVRALMAAARDG